jgi:hypothetical protein
MFLLNRHALTAAHVLQKVLNGRRLKWQGPSDCTNRVKIHAVQGAKCKVRLPHDSHLRWNSKLGTPAMCCGLVRVARRCVARVSLQRISLMVLWEAALVSTCASPQRDECARMREYFVPERGAAQWHKHTDVVFDSETRLQRLSFRHDFYI